MVAAVVVLALAEKSPQEVGATVAVQLVDLVEGALVARDKEVERAS